MHNPLWTIQFQVVMTLGQPILVLGLWPNLYPFFIAPRKPEIQQQGCTTPWRQVAVAIKICTVVPNIGGSSAILAAQNFELIVLGCLYTPVKY